MAVNRRTAADLYHRRRAGGADGRRQARARRRRRAGRLADGDGALRRGALFDRLAERGRLDRFAVERTWPTRLPASTARPNRSPDRAVPPRWPAILDGNARASPNAIRGQARPAAWTAPAARPARRRWRRAPLLDRARPKASSATATAICTCATSCLPNGRAGAVRRDRVRPGVGRDRRALRSGLPGDGPAISRSRPRSASVLLNRYLDVTGDAGGLRRCRCSCRCGRRSAATSMPRRRPARPIPAS